MREERGQISGDITIAEPFDLQGKVDGNVTVIAGGKVYVRGSIFGKLIIESGGRVHLFGNVSGDVTLAEDTKLIISGVVGGDVLNRGGRCYIENTAQVLGKIKTWEGETRHERPPYKAQK